jgi:predicted nucleic acid-binding protein
MFLDTSGLFALIHVRESVHQTATHEYQRASQRVTHGFVLAELVALANARGAPQGPTLTFIRQLLANPKIDIVWPDEALTSQAVALLTARQGRGYSLCDAVSFLVMRAKNLQDALSTDQHLEDEGFKRLLV